MPLPTEHPSIRAFVSLSMLAEDILNLSRARVYELMKRGALPHPCYELRTRRPVFNEEQQRQALAVRQTGLGIDGQPVVFYRRHCAASQIASTANTPRRSRSSGGRYSELVANLQALGITAATEQSVSGAMMTCFPNGTAGQPETEVLRVLFRHLRQ